MIQFDARMLYDLLKSGYQDIFTSIYTDTNMQWDTEKISDKAKKLYKEHGEFTDDGYFLTENQKIDIEALDEGLGVVFEDGLELVYAEKDIPATFRVEVSPLGIMIDEFARRFRIDFFLAAEQIFWLRNYQE